MPACGQAVGSGVCDTPELWRGAAGLCARVRACAGAAESLHTYVHKQLRVRVKVGVRPLKPLLKKKIRCRTKIKKFGLGSA